MGVLVGNGEDCGLPARRLQPLAIHSINVSDLDPNLAVLKERGVAVAFIQEHKVPSDKARGLSIAVAQDEFSIHLGPLDPEQVR